MRAEGEDAVKKALSFFAELYWKLRWSARATALWHVFAMFMPFNSWRIFFYRLRGTNIGRNVYIVQTAFLEESRPWLITVEDNARIGGGVVVLTHDAVFCNYVQGLKNRYAPVIIRKNASICFNVTIFPGVTIGENSIIGACSLVTKDVPPGVLAVGVPAKVVGRLDEICKDRILYNEEYERVERETRYPWKMRQTGGQV